MENQKKFIEYLKNQQSLSLAKSKKMLDEQREDEAILEKIRANIFGIFIAMAKMPNQSPKFLEIKMDEIPTAWHESLEKALEYNDHEKEAQERIKIATMEEIKLKFASIAEEN